MVELRTEVGGGMDSYLESALIRYVIATTDIPTTYLVFKDDNISFTKHISGATKTVGRATADNIKNEFYACTGRTDVELVVIPVRVSYELLKDVTEMRSDFIELLS